MSWLRKTEYVFAKYNLLRVVEIQILIYLCLNFDYIGDCESSLQCGFHGKCEGGKCVCFPEFEGKYCDGNFFC